MAETVKIDVRELIGRIIVVKEQYKRCTLLYNNNQFIVESFLPSTFTDEELENIFSYLFPKLITSNYYSINNATIVPIKFSSDSYIVIDNMTSFYSKLGDIQNELVKMSSLGSLKGVGLDTSSNSFKIDEYIEAKKNELISTFSKIMEKFSSDFSIYSYSYKLDENSLYNLRNLFPYTIDLDEIKKDIIRQIQAEIFAYISLIDFNKSKLLLKVYHVSEFSNFKQSALNRLL